MRAVRFAHLRDTRPLPLAQGWPALRDALSTHAIREDKLAGPLWSPVDYRPGTFRANRNIERVHAFVADLDGMALDDLRPRLAGREWLAYTTHGHRADKPSWHVVLPLAQPVESADWRRAWTTIRAWLRAGDEQTCDASRAYFLPQHNPDRDCEVAYSDGAWLDWRELPVVDVAQRVRREYVKGKGVVTHWDDVEEPAELVGLEGMELRDAALKYVEGLLEKWRAA